MQAGPRRAAQSGHRLSQQAARSADRRTNAPTQQPVHRTRLPRRRRVQGRHVSIGIIVWLRGTVVERRSQAGELSLSHARLASDHY